MAKTGPKPVPTKLKKLRGNPGHRPLPKNEPQPKQRAKVPPAPRYLDAVAKKEWRRVAKQMHAIGLLTEVDITALSAYCQCFSTWVDATKKVQELGAIVRTPSGYPTQSPFLGIANKAQVEMRKWLTEFGMTPSSRSRVEVKDAEEGNDLDDFLDEYEGPAVVKK